MLDFEPSVISAVMSDFDPHAKGFIDYTDFCVNVMGSGPAPPELQPGDSVGTATRQETPSVLVRGRPHR
jgi:hypothetical protein